VFGISYITFLSTRKNMTHYHSGLQNGHEYLTNNEGTVQRLPFPQIQPEPDFPRNKRKREDTDTSQSTSFPFAPLSNANTSPSNDKKKLEEVWIEVSCPVVPSKKDSNVFFVVCGEKRCRNTLRVKCSSEYFCKSGKLLLRYENNKREDETRQLEPHILVPFPLQNTQVPRSAYLGFQLVVRLYGALWCSPTFYVKTKRHFENVKQHFDEEHTILPNAKIHFFSVTSAQLNTLGYPPKFIHFTGSKPTSSSSTLSASKTARELSSDKLLHGTPQQSTGSDPFERQFESSIAGTCSSNTGQFPEYRTLPPLTQHEISRLKLLLTLMNHHNRHPEDCIVEPLTQNEISDLLLLHSLLLANTQGPEDVETTL